MAEYVLLIYNNEEEAPTRADAAVSTSFRDFMDRHAAHLRGGAALQAPGTATSVRGTGTGDVVVTDGVFVESKEVLGGYYVVEAANLDEAVAIARDLPLPGGGIEVRPVRTRS